MNNGHLRSRWHPPYQGNVIFPRCRRSSFCNCWLMASFRHALHGLKVGDYLLPSRDLWMTHDAKPCPRPDNSRTTLCTDLPVKVCTPSAWKRRIIQFTALASYLGHFALLWPWPCPSLPSPWIASQNGGWRPKNRRPNVHPLSSRVQVIIKFRTRQQNPGTFALTWLCLEKKASLTW